MRAWECARAGGRVEIAEAAPVQKKLPKKPAAAPKA